jgi:hypothetical protein
MKHTDLTAAQVSYLRVLIEQEAVDLPAPREIAERLAACGQCIVAGDGKLWGGVFASFIKRTFPEQPAVGCTLLQLDLQALLADGWFLSRAEAHVKKSREEAETLTRSAMEIERLIEIGERGAS